MGIASALRGRQNSCLFLCRLRVVHSTLGRPRSPVVVHIQVDLILWGRVILVRGLWFVTLNVGSIGIEIHFRHSDALSALVGATEVDGALSIRISRSRDDDFILLERISILGLVEGLQV